MDFGKNSRTITLAGFVADPDPNVTAPHSSKVFRTKSRDDAGDPTDGHILVGKFDTEEITGTALFVTWFRNSREENDWYRFTPDTLTHRVGKMSKALQEVDIFVQVKAFANTGAATTFTLGLASI